LFVEEDKQFAVIKKQIAHNTVARLFLFTLHITQLTETPCMRRRITDWQQTYAKLFEEDTQVTVKRNELDTK